MVNWLLSRFCSRILKVYSARDVIACSKYLLSDDSVKWQLLQGKCDVPFSLSPFILSAVGCASVTTHSQYPVLALHFSPRSCSAWSCSASLATALLHYPPNKQSRLMLLIASAMLSSLHASSNGLVGKWIKWLNAPLGSVQCSVVGMGMDMCHPLHAHWRVATRPGRLDHHQRQTHEQKASCSVLSGGFHLV